MKSIKQNRMKRGQEEIVGFVVIVLIVVIAGVFLLAFSLNNKPTAVTENSEVKQFLNSMLQYTGNCSTNPGGGGNELESNIIDCYTGNGLSRCLSNESVCDIANANAKGILEASFKVSNETAIRGYEFRAGDDSNNSIISITKGDCSGSYKGDNVPFMAGGTKIRASLKICS